jgi:hypothetical protein
MTSLVTVIVTMCVSTAPIALPPSPSPAAESLDPVSPDRSATLLWRAAPGDGVTIGAMDGSWHLNARARIQLRAAATSDPTSDDLDELLAAEFLVRRARLAFKGMLLNDAILWNLQLGMSQNDVELDRPIIVRDAWMQWNAPLGVGLRVGQMKVPFDRQRMVSSSALQFADRTRTISELTLDRDIGLQLMHMGLFDKRLVVQAGLFGGDGRNRPTPNSGFLSVGRVQVQPFGAFDDLVEGDIERRESPALAIAAAGGTSVRTTRVLATTGRVLEEDGSEGVLDYGHATVDALFKWRGFSLVVAGLGRLGFDDHGAPEPIARSAVGGFVQAGVMTIGGLELVARAAHTQPIQFQGMAPNDPTLVSEWEASGGVNFYWLGHDLKLNTDLGAIGPEDGPVRVFGRTQIQVFF